jgi:DNA-binding MarR family transcriptional regulator
MAAESGPPLGDVESLLTELRGLVSQFSQSRSPPQGEGSDPSQPTLLTRAIALYKGRRARTTLLGRSADLFGEPAWDILLDLFIAREKGQLVSISSACIAADVPSTTALRWLSVLEQRGLVERLGDPADRRRFHLRLADEAHAQMRQWLKLWS